ncbi:hypothetical protein ABIG06_000426 [Bradyrhizobium sp. USDA 326]
MGERYLLAGENLTMSELMVKISSLVGAPMPKSIPLPRPERMQPPYSSTEVAAAIGVSLDTFYRTRRQRHERDGLPSPISERGPLKWETHWL